MQLLFDLEGNMQRIIKVLAVTLIAAMLCPMGCGCFFMPEDADQPPVNIMRTPAAETPAQAGQTAEAESSPTPAPAVSIEPMQTPEPVYYKSRVNTLNCRSSADKSNDSNVVCQIGFEDKGIFLGVEGEFTKLRLEDGAEVYCYSDYLVSADTQLYAYLTPKTAQKIDMLTGNPVFEADGVTPVMVKNELVDMRLYLPDAVYEQLFATERNITGAPLYTRAVPLMQKDTVKKLVKAYNMFKADGYTLKVYDAYRPLSVQKKLFDIVQNKHWIADPSTTASNHNRGCAIDLSLIIDATGEEIVTPTPMHTFTEESARTCTTWSDEARKNVDYITGIMAKCGFNHIKSEWWHFADTDSKKFMTTDIDLGSLTMKPRQEDNE